MKYCDYCGKPYGKPGMGKRFISLEVYVKDIPYQFVIFKIRKFFTKEKRGDHRTKTPNN